MSPWRSKRRCPHAAIEGIYGDEINHVGGYRLRCIACGQLLDGPVSLANYGLPPASGRRVDKLPHEKPERDHTERRYWVYYDLVYDGGSSEWIGFYRTLVGTRVAVWWNRHLSSWGGSADIRDTWDKAHLIGH